MYKKSTSARLDSLSFGDPLDFSEVRDQLAYEIAVI